MTASPTPSAPGAVVVTFFPDAAFATRLAAIARQYAPVLVVDNSADAHLNASLATLCRDLRCSYLPQPENLGLAVALNRGFAHLRSLGHTAALAFDQDSTPAPGHAAALLAQPDAAVIGSNWHDENRPAAPSRHLRRHPAIPLLFTRVPATADLPEVTCVITSGTLFDLEVWHRLGGFDERLFLDLVDTDYCLRARAAGHRVAVAAGASLAHQRGAKCPIRRVGRTWWPAFMTPLRLRYLFRNRVLLLPRHTARAPHWVLFELTFAAKILAEIVFLEDDKLRKLAACIRGTWDGFLGADGPISNRLDPA